MCFSFAVATAKDIQTIMICRFSLGLLGQQRLLFLQLFFRFISDRAKGYRYFDICWGAFGGPMLAPIFGGFTVKNSSLGWRWTAYFCGIVAAWGLC